MVELFDLPRFKITKDFDLTWTGMGQLAHPRISGRVAVSKAPRGGGGGVSCDITVVIST